ncbi:LamG-like jellyroll fold domain-containing protein [Microbacterium sp. NPDC089987]|uniref:LamG-like jellyroll fold domain-containing protein n=1 Tax=Microbacterium sp. NPDC089987 TaxID=3364202 RepID=UPI00380FCD63
MQASEQASALSPGVHFSADDLPTWQTNGTVYALAASGGKVVAGGTFTQLRPPAGVSGTVRAQTALAVLNADTGAPDACQFAVTASSGTASVLALTTNADQSVVYVAGNFSSIGGVNVGRVAALDVNACVVKPFRPAVFSSTATALAQHGNVLYVGGLFNTVGGQTRRGFAALNATTGALLDWVADAVRTVTNLPADVGQGRAVAVSPDGQKVVVGGDMFEINGQYSHSIAMVSGATGTNGAGGEVLRTYPSGFIPNSSITKSIWSGDDGRFYIGNEGTGGGVFDGRAAFSWETGDQVWRDTCLGATQAVLLYEQTLYSASHAHDCAGINAFNDGVRNYFLAQDSNTAELRGWFPAANDGIGEGIGPRALTVAEGRATGKKYMWTGGEFTRINNKAQQGLTRFGPDDVGAPPAPVVSAVATSDGTIQVRFRTVVDSDDSDLTYSVYRNNSATPVWTGKGSSMWWQRPQVTFVDSAVNAGSTYSYRVTASDGTNTSGLSATASARAVAATTDWDSTVRAAGATGLWSGQVTSGVWALDASANTTRADGAAMQMMEGATTSASSAVSSNSQSFSLDGVDDYLVTDQYRPGLTTYSVSAWINTTTDRGGKIIGYGNGRPRTGTNTPNLSGSYDRHLYMQNDGRVRFGAYNGSTVTVTSPSALNDGSWHLVTGTQGPEGMRLYVDGKRVASNAVSNQQAYWGVWRIGGDNLSGWPSRPSSNFFSGLIDEAAVYPRALTAREVATQYVAAGRDLVTNPVPADDYGKAVHEGDPLLYWRLADSTAEVKDSSYFGTTPGTALSGVVQGVTGIVEGNAAVRVPGSPSGTIATSQSLAPSATVSAEIWFRTTTTSGGKILGFENTATGNGSGYDKHLYMTNDGRLIWGSYIGSAATVTSANSYNNGAWHHAVGVIDSTGRQLYVDGQMVASSAVTGAETGEGYWRLGGGNLSSWPNQPSDFYFNGDLDEFAVYSTSLSPAVVAEHYAIGSVDRSAPSSPAAVTAKQAADRIEVSWDAATDDVGVAHYEVYRGASPDFAVDSSTLLGTTTTLKFTDVSAPVGEVSYKVVAIDASGNPSKPSDATTLTVADELAPSIPDGLAAQTAGTDVSLTWTAAEDNVGVARYDIYRGQESGFDVSASTKIGESVQPAFIDEGLDPGTYYYVVVAEDAAGNRSKASIETSLGHRLVDAIAPTQPGALKAALSDGNVQLSWDASTDDIGVTAYQVHRGSAADFAPSSSTLLGQTAELEYVDSAVPAGTWYYKVIAQDAAGNFSAPASASTVIDDETAPTAPVDVVATVSGSNITVSWSPATDDVAVVGYRVHRGASADFTPTASNRVTTAAPTTFTDVSVTAGTYYYKVIAEDAAGNVSVSSDAASATVVAAPQDPVTMSVVATADAMAAAINPNNAYGTSNQLSSRFDTPIVSFLRFDLPAAPSGMVLDSAQLRVRTSTDPTAGSANAHQLRLASGAWSESQITWNSRLTSVDPAVLGELSGATAVNTAYSAGLSAAGLSGSLGTSATLQMSSAAGTDNLRLWSRESGTAAYRPTLVLNFVPGAGPGPDPDPEVPDVTAPSTPAGVTATVNGATATVSWSASTDDVGVVEYRIHRGSAADFAPDAENRVGVGPSAPFADAGLAPGTYYYRVVAADAAGNASNASAAASAVVAGPGPDPVKPVTISLNATSDSMVAQIAPTTLYGTTNQLSSRGTTPIESFLRFDLPTAPPGTVLSGVELKVRTSTDPTAGSADTHDFALADDRWDQATINWNNRPTQAGLRIGQLTGATAMNTAYSAQLDVAAIQSVLGSTQTLRMSSGGADNVRLWSSEASSAGYRPTLVLQFTPAP